MEKQLSKHFMLKEFTRSDYAKEHNISNTPTHLEYNKLKKLCEDILQPIRSKWKNGIIITSGFRNPVLNSKVGGSPSSQHCKGEAADFKAENGKNGKLFHMIEAMIHNEEIEVGQLIWEHGDEYNPDWIHISLPMLHKKNQILKL